MVEWNPWKTSDLQMSPYLEFSEDYVFNSPSGASNMIAGVATNGWLGWKDSSGKTLDENIRKRKIK